MAGLTLDGKSLAKQIEQELIQGVQVLRATCPDRTPTLATILVGNDPASATYVRMKGNACKRVDGWLAQSRVRPPSRCGPPVSFDERR